MTTVATMPLKTKYKAGLELIDTYRLPWDTYCMNRIGRNMEIIIPTGAASIDILDHLS